MESGVGQGHVTRPYGSMTLQALRAEELTTLPWEAVAVRVALAAPGVERNGALVADGEVAPLRHERALVRREDKFGGLGAYL